MHRIFTAILFPLAIFLTTPKTTFSQIFNSEINSISLPNGNRHRVELQPGFNRVQVTGLKPGKRHLFVCLPDSRESDMVFQVKILNPFIEMGSKAFPESQGMAEERIFVPTDSALEFSVACLKTDFYDSEKAIISVSCLDERRDFDPDSEWYQNFQQKVANLTTATASASSLITNTLIGGGCFGVTGITSFGNAASRGTFGNGNTTVGFNTGMVMASANINFLPGPNNSGGAGGTFGVDTPDDPDLTAVGSGNQFDLSRIEFDFEPTANTVQFDFVFGSEEYCEWVGSNFNDVFGFFISGPGITGNQNIAVLPGGGGPVTINNVNQNSNSSFFVANSTAPCNGLPPFNLNDIQLDGWTTTLTATATVQECETYHLKLAVADRGDPIFGSAVFLKANSFSAGSFVSGSVVVPGTSDTYVYEDCGVIYFKFIRNGGDLSTEQSVDFTILSTSTAEGGGVDYFDLPQPIIIPPGVTEILVPVSIVADGIIEGDETIVLNLNNPCQCSNALVLTIKDVPPLIPNLEDINQCGLGNVVLNPAPEGGKAPYTYVWGEGQTTPTITTDKTGTYFVTITDACGQTATDEANVTITPIPAANLTGGGALCAGQTGSFNLTITLQGESPWEVEMDMNGVPTSYTFTSSPAIITVTEAGTYSIESVSAYGCDGTATGSVTILDNEIEANLNPNDPLCGGTNNGSITATGSGGTAPYGYVWNTSATTQTISGLAGGTYSVTVVDALGCSTTAETTLTQPDPLVVSVNSTTNIDCNNPTGTIDLEVDGGSPSYDFNWSNGSSDEDPEITNAGTFSVTVTDDNGCTKTTSATVTANLTLPNAVAAAAGVINCTTSTITINGNGSSTGSNFTYQWDGPGFVCCETTLNPQVNESGTYTLTVTNTTNGCTKEVSVNVNENLTEPEVVLDANDISCNSPQIQISGSGSTTGAGIVYQWTTADGNIVSGANTLNPTVNLAGTYTLVITNNGNGCTAAGSVTIAGNTILPTASIEPAPQVNCTNPELTLDASGSSGNGTISFNWSASGGGNIVDGSDTATPTIDQGGTYTVTVTDEDNNCTATATVTVGESLTPPLAVANAPGMITCTNAQITINGIGSSTGANFNYEWSGPSFVCCENTLNPQVNEAGTYTLTVTNILNGCTAETEVEIEEDNSIPEADAGDDMELNCYDPTQQLDAGNSSSGSGYTLLWSTSDGNITAGANTLFPTVNQSGTYTILITDTSNGCTAEDEVFVSENFNQPVPNIAPPLIINCLNEEIELDASGSTGDDLDFNWNANPGSITDGDDSDIATVDAGGNYFLTITDQTNGCTATSSVQVVADKVIPTAQAGAGFELDCDMPEGQLNGTGSSVGSNIEYSWDTFDGNIVDGANTLNPTVDQEGTYTLIVTNTQNGCTSEDEVYISADQDLPEADAGGDETLDCTQFQVNLDGSGSTSGFGITFSWTTPDGNIVSGANTLTPLVNAAGSYFLTITNSSTGCSAESFVSVFDNISYPEALALAPDPLDCDNTTAIIDAGGSSQGSEFEYQWTTTNGVIENGEDSLEPTISAPGTYTLLITNSDNSCTATTTVLVNENITPPIAIANPLSNLTCQFPQVQISGNGSSDDGGSTFTYQWTTANGNIVSGQTNLNCTVNQPGNYQLQVLNTENGCTAIANANITTNQTFPTATVAAPAPLTCTTAILQLNGAGSTTGNNIAYVWQTTDGNIVSGGSTLNPTVDKAGTYQLTVLNNSTGCTSSTTITVSTNYNAPTAIVAPAGVLSCTATTLNLNGAGSSTGSNFKYNWTTVGGNISAGGTTLNPTVNAVGTYILEITNTQNGCTSTASTTVAADANLPQANAGLPDTLTCSVAQINISATASTGSNFNYQWSGAGIVAGQNSLSITVNQSGDYVLTVTNTNNGCTAISTVNIGQNIVKPIAEAGNTDVLTCLKTSIDLNAIGTSIGSNFNYNWTNANGNNIVNPTSLNPTVNQAGVYNLLVTNIDNGCTATDVVSITQNTTLPTAEAGAAKQIDCQNPSVQLSGTGSTGSNFTYLWTSTNGNIASGATTLNPTVDAAGTYNLLITNELNGCTATDVVSVSKDANLPVALGVPSGKLTCAVKSIAIDATTSSQGAGFTFNWTSPNGSFVSGQTTLSPIVDKAGQYVLTVLNTNNNCDAIATVNIEIDTVSPIANAGTPAVLSCSNPILNLDGSGSSSGSNFSYNWTTSNGYIVGGAMTLNPQVNESGFYTIQVLDNSNGCTSEATVQILRDQNTPEADAGAAQILTCTHSTLILDGSLSSQNPQFSYLWTASGGGNILSGATTLQAEINQPGTYNLLITNPQNGCTDQASVVVTQDKINPTAAVAAPPVLNCELTSTVLNTAGSSAGSNFTYGWVSIGGNIVAGANSLAPEVDAPGIYTLTILNTANGCSATTVVIVSEDVNTPTADAGATAVLSCTNNSLVLNGSLTNAGNNFSILWTTPNGSIVSGATTLNPTVNASGNYILTVQNNLNKCKAIDNVQITQDASLPVAVAATNGVLTCAVSEVNLSGLGSSTGSQFSYFWMGPGVVSGQTTLNPTVNVAGQYFLTVNNSANDCETIGSITVLENKTPPTAVAGAPVTLTCTATNVKLNGAGSSAGSNFSYNWTTVGGIIFSGGTTLNPTVTAAGTYILQVTDAANGCTATETTQVLQDLNAPTAVAAVAGELTCKISNLEISGAGSSTGSQFSYNWTSTNGSIVSGGTSLNPTVDKIGIYKLVITNLDNGCTTSTTVNILENKDKPTADAGANGLITCTEQNTQLSGSGAGGAQGVLFEWSGPSIVAGNNAPNPIVDATGIYTLVVTDIYNGCTSSDQTQVLPDINLPVVAIAQPAILTCKNLETSLDASGTSAGADFQYSWSGAGLVSGATTLFPKVNEPGVYILLVKNVDNGCSRTAQITVGEDVQKPLAEAGNGFEIDCEVLQGNLDAKGSSTGQNFVYQWNTTDGKIVSGATTLNPLVNLQGTYNLLVTNTSNGCTQTDATVVTLNVDVPTGLDVLSDPPNCTGKKGVVKIEKIIGGTGPFLYSLDGGQNFSASPNFQNLPPGNYDLLIQDARGCEIGQSIVFPTPVLPDVNALPELNLAFGESGKITAQANIPLSEIDTVLWTPTAGLTFTANPLEVIAKPSVNTTYTVRIVNHDGCEDRAKIQVKVDEPAIWVPNVIQVGSLIGNDGFTIYSKEGSVLKINTLQIYDRWGEHLFQAKDFLPNDPNFGWDGTFEGKAMKPGVYVWWAEVTLTDGRVVFLEGDVTLVQ